jgi:hypothetical protein
MRLISLLVLASSASAITMPNFLDITQLLPRKDGGSNSNSGSSSGSSSGKDGSCPSVWSSISSDLTQKFLSGGQCNPDARAAIRAIFHDCGGKPLIFVPRSILTYDSLEFLSRCNTRLRWISRHGQRAGSQREPRSRQHCILPAESRKLIQCKRCGHDR